MTRHILGAVLALALAGCGGSDNSATSVNATGTNSGVQGQVTKGPLSPTASNATPSTAPLPGAVVVVRTADGTEVNRGTSDVNGNYQVAVAPGSYILAGLNTTSGQFPKPPAPQAVKVNANLFTVVNLQYDTGIR